ncbi:MAG: SRPBCC family protein [Acidimicrobiales bacterium]
MKLVDRVVHIDADVHDVYALLTDAEQFVRWMAPTATLDPSPGGVVTWTHLNGDVVAGTYVEVDPNRRIVFTFGWERADVDVPPGSTTVEIDLLAKDGGTELHLVHRGLAGPMAEAHTGGWNNYLDRLAAVAERRDPGPDRLATEHVPISRSLGLT